MPYPPPIFHDEKKFIDAVAARVPSLRAHFERCVNIYPPDRPQKLARYADMTAPSLWADAGVPEDDRPSYAAISGLMAQIAFTNVHDDYDFTIVMQLVRAAHVADVITSDLSALPAEDITRMQDIAMRMMGDNIECRALRDAWEDAQYGTHAESQFTRDLHRIAMTMLAQERRPAAAEPAKLDAAITALRAGIETEHGAAVMDRALRRPLPQNNAPSPD